MTTNDFDGNYATSDDYDVLIESEYYSRDYDDIDFERSISDDVKSQTDILFE